MTPQPAKALDPVTAEIVRNGFNAIVRQMSRIIVRSAFSPIIRDAFDFCCTIVAPQEPPALDLDIVAMSESLAHFSGVMPFLVKNLVWEYGAENLEEGDFIAINNPYKAGNHVNDNAFLKPVFHQGKLLGGICVKAHITDVGGMVPGGYSLEKRSIWEDGLVISGMPVYKRNQPYKPGFNLYFDASRLPHYCLSDIQALFSAASFGEKSLLAYAEKYGVETLKGAMVYSLDYAERSMRQAIAARLPDGVYTGEDGLDGDFYNNEPYLIRVKVTKKGDRAEIDFSGTARVGETSINCSVYDAANGAYTAFKWLFDPHNPNNSGAFRPIDIVIPENTFISALPPATTSSYFEGAEAVFNAVVKALLPGLGEAAFAGHYGTNVGQFAYGHDPRPRRERSYFAPFALLGAFGGTSAGDGEHFISLSQQNIMDFSCEAIEDDFPILILRKEFIQDSPGQGKHRGGPSVVWDRLFLSTAEARNLLTHLRFLPWGCLGGKPGKPGGIWMFTPEKWDWHQKGDIPTQNGLTPAEVYQKYSQPIGGYFNPRTRELSEKGRWVFGMNRVLKVEPDTLFRLVTPSGGGWGEPLERDPELVKLDVRDGFVSPESARRDYGVVIKGDPEQDPEGLAVDSAATRRLRSRRQHPQKGGKAG